MFSNGAYKKTGQNLVVIFGNEPMCCDRLTEKATLAKLNTASYITYSKIKGDLK